MLPAAEPLWRCLAQHQGIALSDGQRSLSYAQLAEQVSKRARLLQRHKVQRAALALDNSLDWVIWDLALLQAGLVCVPLPGFSPPASRRMSCRMPGLTACSVTRGP